MDVLADIMSLLRTSTHLYGRLEFSAPFGFKFPGEKGICIIVTRGSCYLGVDKEPLVPLVGGDFVLLPAPRYYSLRSSPKLPILPVEQITSEKEFHRTRLISFDGGEGPPTTVVAGCFTFSSTESQLLVKHLPSMIHLQASGNYATPWFHS